MKKNRFISDPLLPWLEIRITEQNPDEYKDHFHRQLFIAGISEGNTLVKMGAKSYLAETGALVVIAPEAVHSCSPQNKERSYLVVFVDADWWRELHHNIFADDTEMSFPENPVLYDSELFNRLLRLTDLLEEDGFALEKSEFCTAFISDLLQVAFKHPLRHQQEPDSIIDDVKQLLSANLAENFTLEQLAFSIGRNPYSLLRSFKKSVGMTPHEYRLNLRIEQAKELLRQGLPPAEVAAETGFVDQSHFHRTFRQFVSATPGQYRKR